MERAIRKLDRRHSRNLVTHTQKKEPGHIML